MASSLNIFRLEGNCKETREDGDGKKLGRRTDSEIFLIKIMKAHFSASHIENLKNVNKISLITFIHLVLKTGTIIIL